MIQQVEQTEENFKKNFNENLPNLSEINLDNETQTLNDLFQNESSPLSMEKIETLHSKHAQRLKDLKEKFVNFKYFENCLTRNKFTPSNSLSTETKNDVKLLGKLDLYASVQKLAYENIIICCWDQNEIKMWNLNGSGGSMMKKFTGHSSGVCCLKVFAANKLISGSKDKTIKVFDMKSGECAQTFVGHSSDVRCLHLLADGQHVSSGSEDKNIKVWNLGTGLCVSTLKAHTGYIFCLEQLPSGILLSGSSDKSIRYWDLNTKTCTKVLQGYRVLLF
jgi:WD40 repeat protein